MLRRTLAIAVLAVLMTACGPSSSAPGALPPETTVPTGADSTQPGQPGDGGTHGPKDADSPRGVPFSDVDGELIGTGNMGGEVVDPKPHEIDGLEIAESYPEQLQISFTAGAEGCTAANAKAFGTDTQVIVTLEVGITTDALVKSCLAGQFPHRISIPLTEGLDGREVVVATVGAESDTGDIDTGAPPAQPFAQTLIGLSEAKAEEAVTNQGLIYRVVERDGEPFAVTMDYTEQRINVTIVDGVITAASIG